MAKTKIKKGQTWKHNPSGGNYVIEKIGKIKIPHVGWFPSVSYKDEKGNLYSRFREDFENKFTKL